MTLKDFSHKDLVDYLESQVSCDTYCPTECTCLRSEFSIQELRDELLRRIAELENDLLYQTNYSGLRAT